jgi:transcriptional regulator with PAS, ATPase and Fis domain
VTLRNGIEAVKLRKQANSIRRDLAREYGFDQIIGKSPAMKKMIALAHKIAESGASAVLLQGESGTGKDLVARAIHYGSHRADRPFIAINCAAIPPTLIESELFGYEKGALTDAKRRKDGLLEQAEGGTIFLDEIGELEIGFQAKLLRLLEEGAFRRVGGFKDLPLDVRIIAASDRDLKSESETRKFRLDLYHRLSVIQIDLPPLRKRGDDVLLLADHYINKFNNKLRKRIRGVSPDVADIFRHYTWPGNVRELRNVIERMMILEDDDLITTSWLPRGVALEAQEPRAASAKVAAQSDLKTTNTSLNELFHLPLHGVQLESVEMNLVEQAIKRSGGNQTRAAELLGISRDQMRYRLKKLEGMGSRALTMSSESNGQCIG